MDNLFLAEDVFTSEMDKVLGGRKVTVTYKKPDGTEVKIVVEL
jgi:hypothetical protein